MNRPDLIIGIIGIATIIWSTVQITLALAEQFQSTLPVGGATQLFSPQIIIICEELSRAFLNTHPII